MREGCGASLQRTGYERINMKKRLTVEENKVHVDEFNDTFGLALICLEALYPKARITIELKAEVFRDYATWEGDTEVASTFGLLFTHLCCKEYNSKIEVTDVF